MPQRVKVVGTRSVVIWLLIIIAVVAVAALAMGGLVVYPRLQEQRAEQARLTQVEQHYQAGLAYQNAGDWEAAEAEFKQVIALAANYKDVQSRLAEVRAGLAEGAATATAVAVAQAEQAWAGARATATAQAKATAAAEASAVTATAEALEAHYQRGLGYINLEKWPEAQEELQTVFDMAPNYKDVQAQLALVNEEVAKLIPTATPTPSASPTPKSTPTPITTPTTVPDYSLLDDLENLTVTDGQGQRFQYFQGFPYFGWHLDPWGLIANARISCSAGGTWKYGKGDCTVGGTYASGQVFIHPVSNNVATILAKTFSPLTHDTLTIAYAMPDSSLSGSNGVQIFLALTDENNRSVMLVPPIQVVSNTWTQQTIDISSYVGQRVTLRLEADAIGRDTSDWLQIQLTLSRKNQ